jgi:hypothetical protein
LTVSTVETRADLGSAMRGHAAIKWSSGKPAETAGSLRRLHYPASQKPRLKGRGLIAW